MHLNNYAVKIYKIPNDTSLRYRNQEYYTLYIFFQVWLKYEGKARFLYTNFLTFSLCFLRLPLRAYLATLWASKGYIRRTNSKILAILA